MDVNTNFMGSDTASLVRTPADALQSAINVDLFTGLVNGWYDAGPYGAMNVQLIGGGTITAGAITFEYTNDVSSTTGYNIIFRPSNSSSTSPTTGAITVTTGFNTTYQMVIPGRYVRCRVSTAFTGTGPGARIIAEMIKDAPGFDLGAQTVAIQGTAAVNLSTTTAPTVHTLNSAATTNATSVKATAGRVWHIAWSNQNAAARFLKLYNKASAPTVGTDIPVMVIPMAASSFNLVDFDTFGSQFGTGIAYAITGAIADADVTAVTAGDTKIVINYT